MLYLIPPSGQVLASVVLGEKAASAAHEKGCARDLVAIIEAAPRYAEGRGIRLPVSTMKELAAILQLVAVKMWYTGNGMFELFRRRLAPTAAIQCRGPAAA